VAPEVHHLLTHLVLLQFILKVKAEFLVILPGNQIDHPVDDPISFGICLFSVALIVNANCLGDDLLQPFNHYHLLTFKVLHLFTEKFSRILAVQSFAFAF
jgi:hypothetical protein